MDRKILSGLLIRTTMTIRQAVHKLNDTGERILFIVDEAGRLLGTVTDGDIRRGIVRGVEFGETVEKIMQTHCVSLSQATPELGDAARKIMLGKRIDQIPVLNISGTIVDIISWTDVLGEKEMAIPPVDHPNRVVIMAGGRGTRLDPFTKILPKPLIPIGNRPIIEIIMDRFSQHGFRRFTYTLNYKKEYIKLYLRERNSAYEIDWIEEQDYLGTAGSLSLLREKLSDTFFVTNCDTLLDVNFEEVLKWHQDRKAAITVIGCHNEVTIPFGVIQMSGGKLERLTEKPVHDVIINTGVYVVEPRVISHIPEGGKVDMNELIGSVAGAEVVSVFPIYGGWLDIGKWDEYRKSLRNFEGPLENEE